MKAYTLFVCGRETWSSDELDLVEGVLGCLPITYSTYIQYNHEGVRSYESENRNDVQEGHEANCSLC